MEQRLPEGIAKRKKQGFSIPMKNWIRGEMMEYTRDEIFSSKLIAEYFNRTALETFWKEPQQRRHNHSHLFWALLNLSLWDRILLTGSVPAVDTTPLPALQPALVAAH